MVLMDEAAVILMVIGLWLFGGYALYQRLFVVRKLRRQIEALTQTALAGPATASPAVIDSEQKSEFERIQRRLEVLERIAVDKETSLSREIEGLRAHG